jgi:cystathionine beta-lyase/cystathionine gamma-synthase
MAKAPDRPGDSTLAVHGGERDHQISDAVTTPIFQTSTFWFKNSAELCAYQEGRIEREEYGRYGNPTWAAVERKLCELEGGEEAVLFASGMCAATTLFLALLPKGSHLIVTSDCYRRTRQFIRDYLVKFDVETTVIEPADTKALAATIRDDTALFFTESPTNPYLRVIDVPETVRLVHARGAKVVIDSTFWFKNSAELCAYQEGRIEREEYGRYGNPTWAAVERKLCELEGGEEAVLFASGMCAATTLFLALLPKGSHLIVTSDCYRRTRQFIRDYLVKLDVETTVIGPADTEALASALRDDTALFFTESPTNPYLRVIDVPETVRLVHARGAKVVIDSAPSRRAPTTSSTARRNTSGGTTTCWRAVRLARRRTSPRFGRQWVCSAAFWTPTRPTCSCAGSRRCRCAWSATTPTPCAWLTGSRRRAR